MCEKIVWSFETLAYLENLMISSIKRKIISSFRVLLAFLKPHVRPYNVLKALQAKQRCALLAQFLMNGSKKAKLTCTFCIHTFNSQPISSDLCSNSRWPCSQKIALRRHEHSKESTFPHPKLHCLQWPLDGSCWIFSDPVHWISKWWGLDNKEMQVSNKSNYLLIIIR